MEAEKKILGVKMAAEGIGNTHLDHKGIPEPLLSSFSFFSPFLQ